MDAIFKALNDSTRRAILDALREDDGQSLSALTEKLAINRFNLMQHLKVLEEAHLITTRRVGRFKYHYLNVVPLQEVIDRWIEPLLARDTARAILTLKSELEGHNHMSQKPDLVMATYISTDLNSLWDAITRGDLIAKHHFASNDIRGNYEEGSVLEFIGPEGQVLLRNKVLSITPKSRVEMSFAPAGTEDPEMISRCIYLIEEAGENIKLTVEHYDAGPGHEHTVEGWTKYLAGVKSWLETGKAMELGY